MKSSLGGLSFEKKILSDKKSNWRFFPTFRDIKISYQKELKGFMKKFLRFQPPVQIEFCHVSQLFAVNFEKF